jgi:hypothetical protein
MADNTRQRRRQLHVWLSDADYEFITTMARRREETIAAVVRRIICRLRVDTAKTERISTRATSSESVGTS